MDVMFMHTYAFVFFRFKSGNHWFAVWIVTRNMLIALSPTMPAAVAQITTLASLFVASLGIGAYFRPWRVEIANYVDFGTNVFMIIFICLGSLLIEDVESRGVAILCSVLMVAVLTMLFAVSTYSAVAFFARKHQKSFEYFISHHKESTGAFARLLKAYLVEKLAQRSIKLKALKVFIDCDDLVSLEGLFDYVASHTANMVVLLNKEILSRPWCLGELVTAHKHKVAMAIVEFPDFPRSSGKVPADHVLPDITCLGPSGMNETMIQEMIQWLHSLECVRISSALSGSLMQKLTSTLEARKFGGETLAGDDTPSSAVAELSRKSVVAVVADNSNMESLASALVLCKLVGKSNLNDVSRLPRLYSAENGGGKLPTSTKTCVFMLSNGVFSNLDFTAAMTDAARLQVRHIPVVIEDTFRFPSPSAINKLGFELCSLLAGAGVMIEGQELSNLITDMFQEIAIVFLPSKETEEVLMARCSKVKDRLLSDVKTFALRSDTPSKERNREPVASSANGTPWQEVEI
jgi:hypothetical protein